MEKRVMQAILSYEAAVILQRRRPSSATPRRAAASTASSAKPRAREAASRRRPSPRRRTSSARARSRSGASAASASSTRSRRNAALLQVVAGQRVARCPARRACAARVGCETARRRDTRPSERAAGAVPVARRRTPAAPRRSSSSRSESRADERSARRGERAAARRRPRASCRARAPVELHRDPTGPPPPLRPDGSRASLAVQLDGNLPARRRVQGGDASGAVLWPATASSSLSSAGSSTSGASPFAAAVTGLTSRAEATCSGTDLGLDAREDLLGDVGVLAQEGRRRSGGPGRAARPRS